MRIPPPVWLAAGVAATAAGGFLGGTAIAQNGDDPVRTVTVNVGTGEQGEPGPPGPAGPAGPAGPPGPAGGQTCPAGFRFGVVVFNAPGGQQTIATCLKD